MIDTTRHRQQFNWYLEIWRAFYGMFDTVSNVAVNATLTMPIKGYIIHNNFIVLSCEIAFIFSAFNLKRSKPRRLYPPRGG